MKDKLKYALYIIRHPFDGFWCIKSEKRGDMKSALILFGIFLFTMILRVFASGKIVSSSTRNISVWMFSILVIGVYVLFCISNWSLTTLMNGSGKLSDIFIATAYTLTPVIFLNIPMQLVSYVISLNEIALYNFFSIAAIIWTLFLLLAANLSTHDYSMRKSVLTFIMTIAVMFLIVTLGILFCNLLQQVYVFLNSVLKELLFRMG